MNKKFMNNTNKRFFLKKKQCVFMPPKVKITLPHISFFLADRRTRKIFIINNTQQRTRKGNDFVRST